LDGLALDPALRATTDMEAAVGSADVLVVGAPSHAFREVMVAARPHVRPWIPVVSLSKGLEGGSHKRMTEIIAEELPGHPAGLLAGPNIAREILQGMAAAAVVAMTDEAIARSLQALFTGPVFRVYTNDDVIGCELGGPLKNVIAIASGMGDGLGVGDNTRAMVITRGLAELSRLGVALGGGAAAFAGLAGMGDLLTTCMSPHSRNRRVGEELGRGRKLDEIIADMRMVAEGVKTTPVVMELAAAAGVAMPIAREVSAVLAGEQGATDAFRGLRRLRPRSESHEG
ncbi:MAG: NAD(P)H-dependent glycerol-3-phosphate dehydrogenase, partial [Salinisphaera sp.]|nr:NAD(P)H-dependent glycerol-3-phosphate dehydrogenase [Salinisphaera sp.]